MTKQSLFILLGLYTTMANSQIVKNFLRERQNQKRILDRHNMNRRDVGVPDLLWSNALEASAKAHAKHLAESCTFEHSNTEFGENLAWGTSESLSVADMVQMWVDEKQFFIEGEAYPDVSTTGKARDVGHYTQVVWRDTTHVGCGLGQGQQWDVLVCQYFPPGNWRGEVPF